VTVEEFEQLIYAAVYHPFESPGLHIALRTEMKFAEFLGEVERRLSQELSQQNDKGNNYEH
jgi:hypothetical protein